MKVGYRRWQRLSPASALAWCVALGAGVAPCALSVAQTLPATETVIPAPPRPAAPTGAQPSSVPATPVVEAVVPRVEEPAPIALVLPLASPIYGRAAEAVKAGFTAAAVKSRARFTVLSHSDGDVVDAFAKAKSAGARVIVGPLVRDDLKALLASGDDLPWTIALNQLDEGAALPPRVYSLALAIEGEGVQLARRAYADGARSVVVLGSDTPLQKRLASAFVGEWILLGGNAPVSFRFDRAPDMLALTRREIVRAAPDAVLLALDAQDAVVAKPYVGRATVYASSQINERQSGEISRELDNVRFIEIPWLAVPTSPLYAGITRRDFNNPTLDRLYALGIDAYRAAEAFVDGAPSTLEFDGATGHLALDRTHQFVREATMLEFRDGEAVVVGTR